MMKVSTVWRTSFCARFAYHWCSPLGRGLHEEELCKVAFMCHLSLDEIFLCQD